LGKNRTSASASLKRTEPAPSSASGHRPCCTSGEAARPAGAEPAGPAQRAGADLHRRSPGADLRLRTSAGRGGDGKEWRRIRAGAAREGRRGAAPGFGGRRRALPGHQRGHPSRRPYNPSRQRGPKPDARQGKGTAAGTPAAGEQQMQANNSGSTGNICELVPPEAAAERRGRQFFTSQTKGTPSVLKFFINYIFIVYLFDVIKSL